MSDFSCSFEQFIPLCMYVIQCFTCTGTGIFTGRTTAPIASFVCGAGVVVELDELCDGVDDCGGGDDEETALCESEFHCASLFIKKLCSLQTSACFHTTGLVPFQENVSLLTWT